MYGSEGASGYVIPRYRAPADASWYHVLHGNIPGHQIDFMYCPEVPQGALTTTHFSHLARLMKYIEPATGTTHAFAIGNLSRDDTQHEPGHGAVGLIFGFRIGGAVDHAGRGNPPFAHGIVAVDRDLGYTSLLEASATFYRHVMNATELNSSAGMFYREYTGAVREAPERVAHVLERYVEEFGDLPYLRRSGATWDWVADEGSQPKRVVIVHKADEPFGVIAHAAAKIAAVLYRSNIKWTSITSGREADIPGGVSVRFVRERDVTMEDRHGGLIRIEDVAEDSAEIARRVFGARPQGEQEEKPQFGGWRERYAAQQAGGAAHLAQTAGGAVPGASGSDRGLPMSAQPAPWHHERGEAHGHAVEGPGAAVSSRSAGAPAMGMGPKGTLVIDAEKLLRGVLPGEAAPGHAAPGGAALGGAAVGGGAIVRSPAEAARAAGAPAPQEALPPPVPARAGAADEELGDIPIVVEQPRGSRKALWAVAGLGCAVAAGVVAWVVSKPPETQPMPPGTEPPAQPTQPAPERGTPGASATESAGTAAAPTGATAAPTGTAAAEKAGTPEKAGGAEEGSQEKSPGPAAGAPTAAAKASPPGKQGSTKSGAKVPAEQQQRGKNPERAPEDQRPLGAIQPKVKF